MTLVDFYIVLTACVATIMSLGIAAWLERK